MSGKRVLNVFFTQNHNDFEWFTYNSSVGIFKLDMTNQPSSSNSHHVWLLLSGVFIGCLCGLTTSPVIQGVVTALLAVIISVAGVLSGLTANQSSTPPSNPVPQLAISPLPLAVVTFGLLFGACFGAFARHNVPFWQEKPEESPSVVIARWKPLLDPKKDQVSKEIAQRLFDLKYNAKSTSTTKTDVPSVLFSSTDAGDACSSFEPLEGDLLRKELRAATDNKHVLKFVEECKNDDDLKLVVTEILCRGAKTDE